MSKLLGIPGGIGRYISPADFVVIKASGQWAWFRHANVVVAILVLMAVSVPVLPAQLVYSVTDLGTLGGNSSSANAINDLGQVVGGAYTASNTRHAFLYSGGVMTDLGTLGGSQSEAYGINNSGQIGGYSCTPGDAAQHAFLYSGGLMQDLGTLGGSLSWAYAINNSGQLVGTSYLASGVAHAFLYSEGTMTDLGTLGGMYSGAHALNNKAQVVGFAMRADYFQHAFLEGSGTMAVLSTLGGTQSKAYGVNSNGQVVGYSETSNNVSSHAFLYSSGVMTDLGALSGTQSQAYGVNNFGQVVGASGSHAFLYSGGMMMDLNSLVPTNSGWTLQSAAAINDKGQIVGCGINPSGRSDAFLLTPSQTLFIKPSAGGFVISWFTNSPIAFSLFQNTDLGTTNWIPVTNSPARTNGQNQVVIPNPLFGRCFYRLQSR